MRSDDSFFIRAAIRIFQVTIHQCRGYISSAAFDTIQADTGVTLTQCTADSGPGVAGSATHWGLDTSSLGHRLTIQIQNGASLRAGMTRNWCAASSLQCGRCLTVCPPAHWSSALLRSCHPARQPRRPAAPTAGQGRPGGPGRPPPLGRSCSSRMAGTPSQRIWTRRFLLGCSAAALLLVRATRIGMDHYTRASLGFEQWG